MSAAFVRSYYGVPARRGMRVVADGKPGVIVGFDRQYLRVRLDGDLRPTTWHPTWHMRYLAPNLDPQEKL